MRTWERQSPARAPNLHAGLLPMQPLTAHALVPAGPAAMLPVPWILHVETRSRMSLAVADERQAITRPDESDSWD
jgi:hypothetical protein